MSIAQKAVAAQTVGTNRASFKLAPEGPLSGLLWGLASVGLFAGIWELCWALGWANPMLLPPPHIFLNDFLAQGRFFDRVTRIGNPSGFAIIMAVLKTVGISTMRVLAGLAIAFFASLLAGAAGLPSPTIGRLT